MNFENSPIIASLNDHARQTFTGCRVILSCGVSLLDDEQKRRAFHAVKSFNKFTPENDPYGEHDFGSIRLGDHLIFWKFEYYDLDLGMHSLDPAEPEITARILTIMLADEY